jgi:hypothetical protein
MTNEGKKLEPPLKLNMSFEEALSRFVATKPQEVDENIDRAKTKKPPQADSPRRQERAKRRERDA